jgi:hypothetical protein
MKWVKIELSSAVKIVNFIKTSAPNTWMFEILCLCLNPFKAQSTKLSLSVDKCVSTDWTFLRQNAQNSIYRVFVRVLASCCSWVCMTFWWDIVGAVAVFNYVPTRGRLFSYDYNQSRLNTGTSYAQITTWECVWQTSTHVLTYYWPECKPSHRISCPVYCPKQ